MDKVKLSVELSFPENEADRIDEDTIVSATCRVPSVDFNLFPVVYFQFHWHPIHGINLDQPQSEHYVVLRFTADILGDDIATFFSCERIPVNILCGDSIYDTWRAGHTWPDITWTIADSSNVVLCI